MAEYKVSSLDDLDYFEYRETKTGRIRHELGITAFGVNAWLGENVGDRVIPEHAEDQEHDQDELYVVVRGRARFEVRDDTIDAPAGTLVYVTRGPDSRRTAFAEETGTLVVAIGGTPGRAFEVHGWEYWGPYNDLYAAGDYETIIARGRETIEANPYAMPLYNLACVESLSGHKEDAIRHLGKALEVSPSPEFLRDLAQKDSDLDAIRDDPAFQALFV